MRKPLSTMGEIGQDMGASLRETGSRPLGQAPQAGLDASRFDPARVLAQMRYYYENAKACGWTPVRWHISESLHRDLSAQEARRAQIMSLPITVHDEWSWGWMLAAKPVAYALDRDATFWEPRDSDGSPEGGDAEGGSVRSATARAEGIAQETPSSTS